jgi:hypothetical protein
MPAAVYPLLLLLCVFVLGSAFFKSELFGHFLLLAFAIALMVVINHYSELYVWGLAYQARSPWARSFLANSAITVASIAPAIILGLVWTVRERVHSFALYAAAIATATSGLAAAYGEIARLAPYYPRFSLVALLGYTDLFAVVGAVVPVALSIAAVRKARLPLVIPNRYAAPPRRFTVGVTGCRLRRPRNGLAKAALSSARPAAPICSPSSRAKPPCSAMTARKAPAIFWSSPAPAATGPPVRWCRRPWNGAPAWSASIPQPKSCGWPMRPGGPSAIG